MMDERSRRVLFAVIQCYIGAPGPVGSRFITKKFSFGLSPATIRNIMSDLEDLGFLRQPHTSAGRVPTDTGYRFYVDTLKNETNFKKMENFQEIAGKLQSVKKDINIFLDGASRMLSSLSHYIGITVSPNESTTTLHKIELIKYRKDQVAVILFTDEGVIRNRVVSIDPALSQRDLNRIAEYINSRYTGCNLNEIRSSVINEISREKVICDELISEAVRICSDVFETAPGNIFISGLSDMLALPDFEDITRIKYLLKTIEDKHMIIHLLDKISESDGTQVFIGSENPVEELKKFSLVVSAYREKNRPIGAIGIIGPTRMDYLHAISLVNSTASYITEVLSCR